MFKFRSTEFSEEAIREKTTLTKDSSIAGKTTIVMYIAMRAVALVIKSIFILCGFAVDVPNVGDPYSGFTPICLYLYEGLISLFSVFIPSMIIIKSSENKISELIPFKKIEGKKLFAIVMCGISLCMIAQLVTALIKMSFSLFGIDIYKGLDSKPAAGTFDFLMSSICTALIPAFVEEFAYRGFVLGILQKHGDMFAIFASAFLFGMLHGNFVQIPFAFVVGLILGYVRVKTGSILPGILIHFGNNFYSVSVTVLNKTFPKYSEIIGISIIMVLLLSGFFAAKYIVKNEKNFFVIENKKSYLTYSQKLKIFFTTGNVIASTIILTLTAFLVFIEW